MWDAGLRFSAFAIPFSQDAGCGVAGLRDHVLHFFDSTIQAFCIVDLQVGFLVVDLTVDFNSGFYV